MVYGHFNRIARNFNLLLKSKRTPKSKTLQNPNALQNPNVETQHCCVSLLETKMVYGHFTKSIIVSLERRSARTSLARARKPRVTDRRQTQAP
jgi:hypothetical protein